MNRCQTYRWEVTESKDAQKTGLAASAVTDDHKLPVTISLAPRLKALIFSHILSIVHAMRNLDGHDLGAARHPSGPDPHRGFW